MNSYEALEAVLKENAITTLFQPIVSLSDGAIFAYEALSRIAIESFTGGIESVFKVASEQNKLWAFEMLCRTRALKKARNKPSNSKLFLNFDPHTIRSPQLKSGFTMQKLQEYELNAEDIVFEITEKSAITDLSEFSDSILHYREQNFQIAIDDFGSGYSGFNRVCSFSPEFLKIDMNLIRNIDQDAIKKAAVSTTIKFCKEAGIKVIAEGIETEAELKTLISIGADYGQGYYLALPKEHFEDVHDRIKQQIYEYSQQNELLMPTSPFGKIKRICDFEQGIPLGTPSIEVYQIMQSNEEIRQFFVVDSQQRCVGILTREKLLQTYSGQYGYNLGRRMNVDRIMQTDFLSVDFNSTIEEVARLAMLRPSEKTYDSIAITEEDRYIGSISVKTLLLTSIQHQLISTEKKTPFHINSIEFDKKAVPFAALA